MSARGFLSLPLVAVLVLAGCGTEAEPATAPSATGSMYPVDVEEPTSDPPNQVSLRLPDGGVEKLTTWSYCLPGICADGWRRDGRDLFAVGSPDHVDFTFGVPGSSGSMNTRSASSRPAPPASGLSTSSGAGGR